MARGRIIDRDLFSHETLGELSVLCRLFYIGLIVLGDDEGRLKGSPKYLKAKIFPYDDISEKDISDMVNQLATAGFLVGYQVETKPYLAHPKWEKWQPIRRDRFKPSDCPSSVDGQPMVNQRSTAGIPLPNLTKPNQTKDGKPSRTIFSKPDPKEIQEYCQERGNNVDPQAFFDFHESKGWMVGKNKMKDWRAAVRTWEKRPDDNNGGGSWMDKDVMAIKQKLKEKEMRESEKLKVS